MTDLEPGDRPITIYTTLPASMREYHSHMICEIMNNLRTIFPEVEFDWEETP